jgi:hypothetical protein
MTTLKEFEEALREQGMQMALAVLEKLRQRDRAERSIAPARRVTGRKMTAELARQILDLHAATNMTQQEIAFQLGVNQGRVNEVIKRGKWLTDDPAAPEARARDQALERAHQGVGVKSRTSARRNPGESVRPLNRPGSAKGRRQGAKRRGHRGNPAQLDLGDF